MTIAFDQIARNDLSVMTGHGSQWRANRGCITCGIDRWVRHALQELVELEVPALIELNVRSVEIELIQIRNSTGGVKIRRP